MALWDPLQLGTSAFYAGFRLTDTSGASTASTEITQAAGTVSQWWDWSGNARHVAQTTAGRQPAYGTTAFNTSYPGLTFANSVLNRAISDIPAGTLISIFAVGQFGTGNDSRIVSFGSGATDTAGTHYIPLLKNSGNAAISSYSNGYQSAAAVALNTPAVFGTVPSGTQHTAYANGTAATPVSFTYPSTYTPVGFGIGADGVASFISSPLNGILAEVVIVLGAISSADIDRIFGYLAWKYGLQGSLPTAHAYKSAAPTVGGLGAAAIAESATSADTQSQTVVTVSMTPAETASAADTGTVALRAAGATTEAASAADTSSASVTSASGTSYSVSTAETGNATDAVTTALAAAGAVSEAGAASDAASAAQVVAGSVSEAGSAADASSYPSAYNVSVAEAASAVDTVSYPTGSVQIGGGAGGAPVGPVRRVKSREKAPDTLNRDMRVLAGLDAAEPAIPADAPAPQPQPAGDPDAGQRERVTRVLAAQQAERVARERAALLAEQQRVYDEALAAHQAELAAQALQLELERQADFAAEMQVRAEIAAERARLEAEDDDVRHILMLF